MEILVRAHGHENVSAAHSSTFEVTNDDFLTPAGDCILGIEADTVAADVPDEFVDACQSHGATITATFEAAGHTEVVRGSGHPDLSYENERSMVGRTSEHVDDRTVMVDAGKAAEDFDRDLIDALAGGAELTMTLAVEP